MNLTKKQWKNLVLAIVEEIDSDIAKSYDIDYNIDGLTEEDIEYNINKLINVAKKTIGI